jgi:hypothetical protein
MKIIIPQFEITEGDGFKQDLFNRKPFAQALTNLIRRTNDPLVIGIDGNWGEGKTTFVKSWQDLLNENHIPNIYIDAFASDYVDDAFMVVAGAISDYMQEKAPPEKASEFINTAKKVGAHVLSIGTKIAIRVATGGLANADDLKGIESTIEGVGDDISNSAEEYIKSKLISHKKEHATIQQFKSYLSTIPETLSSTTDNSLTIIIDELDRCRPSFAVEMLEKIKHLFSVKNVTFVLVINKLQLEESIRSTYGGNIDAHTYLQKFLTIEASIPKMCSDNTSIISKYCYHLAHTLEIPNNSDVPQLFEAIGEHLSLTLRQLEKSYSNFMLALASGNIRINHSAPVLVFLCIIKSTNPSLFNNLQRKDISYADIFNEISYVENEEQHSHLLRHTMTWIKSCLMSDSEYASYDLHSNERRVFQGTHISSRRDLFDFILSKVTNFSVN